VAATVEAEYQARRAALKAEMAGSAAPYDQKPQRVRTAILKLEAARTRRSSPHQQGKRKRDWPFP